MLAIVLPNAELMDSFKFYEFFEYIFTLSFGPFLYFFCLSFLGESKFGNPINYLVHFLPVVSYSFIIFLGFINHGVIVEIPIWVPLLHLQSYTIWLVIRVYNSKKNQESVNERTINLLGTLSFTLILVHVLQWVRYFYSDFELFEFLIPLSSFLIFYLFILSVFAKKETLIPFKKKAKSFFPNSDLSHESERLDKFIRENKMYRNQGLTIDLLSDRIGLPSYKVSYLINNVYELGFNDFINEFRIDEAKKLLNSPEYDRYTIEAISHDVGFNSRSTFYAAFKKITGMTPSVYKDKVCSNL